MSTLHATINALASELAHKILAALRDASLDEIIAETRTTHTKRTRTTAGFVAPARPSRPSRPKRGRRARRSAGDLVNLAGRIVMLVRSHKQGINAEGIKAALGIERKELPRPLALALKAKTITKQGHKRATKYFAA